MKEIRHNMNSTLLAPLFSEHKFSRLDFNRSVHGRTTGQQFVEIQCLRNLLGLLQGDYNMWRCGGRLYNADISYFSKYLILLKNGHYFTALVVRRAHLRECHNEVI